MSAAPAVHAEPDPLRRSRSLDLLRGADVLLMLFVNEVAGVRGAPAFLRHVPSSADGMTVPDVVFPAFLFMIGMSVPFGLGGRLQRGHGRAAVWRHVLARTAALLVMGVMMVNADRAAGGALRHLWVIAMVAAMVCVWQAPAPGRAAAWQARLRLAGAALLVVLVLAYRAEGGSGWIQMRPLWWGILGLIGWAYLVAAAAYLLAGERPAVLVGLVGLLYCLFLAAEAGGPGGLAALKPWFAVGTVVGSHGAIAVSGLILGLMITAQQREGGSPQRLVVRALGYAAALAAAGLLLHAPHALHPAFWINKPRATPAWSLLCSAIACAAWAVLHALVEVEGWRRWPKLLAIAGENALLAYLLPYLLLSLFALSAPLGGGTSVYDALAATTWAGLLRAAAFAWLVVRLCGLMRSYGVRIQL